VQFFRTVDDVLFALRIGDALLCFASKKRKDELKMPEPPQADDHSREEDVAADPLAPEDFYYEGPWIVFTAAYLLKRGYCCNSNCRHCPYR
jgi:hypothetical protein